MALQAANKNHNPSQYELAICYQDGSGILPDAAQALYWFRSAAAGQYAPAENRLCDIYQYGEFRMEINRCFARRYYEEAIKHNEGKGNAH